MRPRRKFKREKSRRVVGFLHELSIDQGETISRQKTTEKLKDLVSNTKWQVGCVGETVLFRTEIYEPMIL